MSRICIVTHIVAPWDGQGRVNHELARYLVSAGHEVTLVASVVEPELARLEGIRWIRIPVPGRVPEPFKWLVFAALARLRVGPRVLTQFDIVHLNGAIAPIQCDLNTSHFVHAGWQRHGPARLDRWQRLVTRIAAWTERRAYRSARRVVAVSELVAKELREAVQPARGRLRVIYNGVDPVQFRPRRSSDSRPIREGLDLPASAFVVLFIGDARSTRKNLDLALTTLARLESRFHLAVIGDYQGGPYPALAEQLGVSGRVHFLGPRRDVPECLRDADALLCPSHYEPASLVLLEGMASGLPVIGTPTLGNAPFIDHGVNGFRLRTTSDHERAAWLLEALERDPELRRRVGAAARNTACQLTWTRMARAYAALYDELLSELRPSRVTDLRFSGPSALSSAGGQA